MISELILGGVVLAVIADTEEREATRWKLRAVAFVMFFGGLWWVLS